MRCPSARNLPPKVLKDSFTFSLDRRSNSRSGPFSIASGLLDGSMWTDFPQVSFLPSLTAGKVNFQMGSWPVLPWQPGLGCWASSPNALSSGYAVSLTLQKQHLLLHPDVHAMCLFSKVITESREWLQTYNNNYANNFRCSQTLMAFQRLCPSK